MEIFLGIMVLLVGVVLIVAVLSQSGQEKNLSTSISGMSDTFYGKNKGKARDRLLMKITAIASVLFVVLNVIMYIYVVSH